METLTEDPYHKLQLSYRLLFERNPLPMWVYDVKTLRMLAVNEAAAAQYGYSKQQFVGLTLLDLCHADEVVQLHQYLKLPSSEQAMPRLWRHRRCSGDLIEVEMVTEELEHEGVHARMALVREMTGQRRAEQAQRELADRLATTLESIPDAFITLDRDWRITYVNGHAETLLHSRRDTLLGHRMWEKFPEMAGTVFQTECEHAAAQVSRASFEALYAPWAVWLAVDAYPAAQGLAVYFRDVTQKHLAEQLLHEERETLAAVLNSTSDAVISIDSAGRIKMFNPGAERIFRRTRASVQGQSVELLLPERFQVAHRQHPERFAELGGALRMMGLGLVKGLRSDGQEVDLEGCITRVFIEQQQVLIASLRDVTDRMRADAEFRRSRAQLSDLTQRLMTQEKVLVKRLAQALHDQLGQTMAAIRMAHETIVTLQGDKTSTGVTRIQAQMGTLINQAIRQVRQVLIELRPPLLEDQGLPAALDNELRNRSLTKPQVDIVIDVQPEIALMRWPTEVEYAVFMVVREAVDNALRHSGASSVSVRLSGTPASLQLEVVDNGVGITAGATMRTGHLGILGMQERANSVGATVIIDSTQTKGTRVEFAWQPTVSWQPSI